MTRLEHYPMPHISYSQISTFLRCSFSFHQAYILKNRDSGNKYSKLGNVFHDVAEAFPSGGKPKDMADLYLRLFNTIPKEMFDDHFERQQFFDKGVVAIRNYGRHYKDAPEPIEVERKMHVRVEASLPPVLAFIDRIDGDPEDPSTWIITDYKTSNNPWPKSKLKDEFQMGLYALLCYKVTGHFPQAVQYYFPVPDKFVIAIHQGDGVYRYQNQREPVLEFNVADVIILLKNAVEEIMKGEFGTTLCGTFFCNKFCYYNQQGIHPPAPTNAEVGWGDIQ